jgi:hypothetical protein
VRTFFQNKRQRHKFTNLEPTIEDARVSNIKTRSAAARWRKTRQALRFAGSQLGVVGRRLEEAPNVDTATKAVVDKCLMAHRSASFAEREAKKALSAGKKPRRTKGQWDTLNGAFLKDPKPGEAELKRLSAEVGITLRQVRTFFQNKRQRHKFTNLEPTIEDARVSNIKTRSAVEAAQDLNAGLQADNVELKNKLARAEADLEALVEASNDMVSDLMIYGRITQAHLDALWGAGLKGAGGRAGGSPPHCDGDSVSPAGRNAPGLLGPPGEARTLRLGPAPLEGRGLSGFPH